MKVNYYGPIFWIHLLIVIFLAFSWLFFSWWLIIIFFILIKVQDLIIGSCFLSKMEFGRNETCMAFYLHRWKIAKNKKRARIIVGISFPVVVIAIAVIRQVILKIMPIIF